MTRLGELIYRWLLRMYPAPMRARFGADMISMFREMAAHERRQGRWAAAWFMIRACLDVPVSAWRSRRQWASSERSGGRPWLVGWPADLRQAARSLRRAPGFSAAAVITLGLGMGATGAIFGIADAVLLRPLPYPDSEQLAFVRRTSAEGAAGSARLAGADLADVRAMSEHFAGVGGVWAMSTNLSDAEEPEQISLGWVTTDLFDVLRVRPVVGRRFSEDDVVYRDLELLTDPEFTPPPMPVILSHGLFVRRYGANPDVLDRTIRINGQSMKVIGVAPRDFRLYLPPDSDLPSTIDAWTLFPADPLRGGRGDGTLTAVARLQPDASIDEAREALGALAARWRSEFAEHDRLDTWIDIVPMREAVVGHFEPTLVLFGGAVAFVLLIACANVASLLLVRSIHRRRELAIRSAIGGGRGRLVRYLLHEIALIVGSGTVLGLLVASLGTDLVRALGQGVPRADSIGLDARGFAFTAGLSIVVTVIFGAWPVWRASATNALGVLGTRSASGTRGQRRGRSTLVAVEVALSVVLLVGAGLMLRTLVNLQRVRLGFEPAGVVTANVSLPFFSYRDPESRLQFFTALVDAVEEAPGVEAAGATVRVPLAGGDGQDWIAPYALEEGDEEAWERNAVSYRPVMPGYFETMRTRLLTGRTFTDADNRPDTRLVVAVDEVFANRVWPAGNAVGQRLLVNELNPGGTASERVWADVIGVVERPRQDALGDEGTGTIFLPYHAFRWFQMTIVVRSSHPVETVAELVRGEVATLDADLPVFSVRSMESYVNDALAPTRFVLMVLGGFAGVALLLAMVGLYGVVAYAARSRIPEIGVRLAFGASRERLLRSVFVRGMQPALLGTGLGVVGAIALGRMVDHLLFGVAAVDAVTYGVIAAVILVVSSAAAYLPARGVVRVDPVEALRAE